VPVISGLSESLFAADDLASNKGGACVLDCRKMALTTMTKAVAIAAMMAIESTGRRAMESQARKPKAPAPLTTRVKNDCCRRLGTCDALPTIGCANGDKARLSER